MGNAPLLALDRDAMDKSNEMTNELRYDCNNLQWHSPPGNGQ
jgi:hypothetical protein